MRPHRLPRPDVEDPHGSKGWRARRDASCSEEEIAGMSPVRRERALAVQKAAAKIALNPMANARPAGKVEAIRIMLQVAPATGPADWAELHRVRERERMRRRREAGDPGIREAHQRWMDRLHAGVPEVREGRRATWRKQDAKRRAAREAEAQVRSEAEAERPAIERQQARAWVELQAALAELERLGAALGLTLPEDGPERSPTRAG